MNQTSPLPPEFTPLLEGIEVVRSKAFAIALWALVVFIGIYYISEEVILWLRDELVPEGASIILLSPVELILLKIKLASVGAMIAVLPPVAYLLWRHARENLDVQLDLELGWVGGILLLMAAGLLFAAGVAYSVGFMMPVLLEYLYTDATDAGLEVTYSLGEFLHFTLMLTVALGLGFELPLVVWLLVKGEIVTYSQLAQYRRHLFMLFFILAAFITPPDVISQLVLALPMSGLFELSLLMMRLMDRDQFLVERGQMLDRRTPYAPRSAHLLTLYGSVQWLLTAGLMYGLLWYAHDHEFIALETDWLLTRQELIDELPLLILPLLLATLPLFAIGDRGRLSYNTLLEMRPAVYLATLLVVAWVTPSGDPWPHSFFLLVVPVLAGFEMHMALFRSAAIHPLPKADVPDVPVEPRADPSAEGPDPDGSSTALPDDADEAEPRMDAAGKGG